MIRYTEEKIFTQDQTEALFKSAGWISGNYPERLHKALMNSDTVITAWDGKKLTGLVRVLDDTEMVAYMHYLLVRPDYQGRGIAKNLLDVNVNTKMHTFYQINMYKFYDVCEPSSADA